MDHMQDIKTRIRERLKKLDEINKTQRNLKNSPQSESISNQYVELIAERLKNIERIRNEILNKRSALTDPPPIPKIVQSTTMSNVVQSPSVQPEVVKPPDFKSGLKPPRTPEEVVEATKNSPSVRSREQRLQERERRMRSGATSGCGCTRKSK